MPEDSGYRLRRFAGLALGGCVVLTACLAAAAPNAGVPDIEGPAIRYSRTTPDNAVTQLQLRIDRGEVRLTFDRNHGFLVSLLRALRIPMSSQVLVMSKTSVSRRLISPRSPRALYFNDRAYVAWVRGAPSLELSAFDPRLGPVFYLLPQVNDGRPRFVRVDRECLLCHVAEATNGLPGYLMRSVSPDPEGAPLIAAPTYVTNDASPMRERWGGWYVTGTSGTSYHMGNATLLNERAIDGKAGSNVTSLAGLVDAARYLTRHSDIVALMVLGHQTHVQSLIARASYWTRASLTRSAAARGPARTALSTGARGACEELVRGLLFSGAAPLSAPVSGTSGFSEEFARGGPTDRQGRSLRDLDLRRRLLRYPCSYLIYSQAFDGLPSPARRYVYRRLWQILSGDDTTSPFAHLTADDRRAIRQILLDTKPAFRAARPAI